MTTTLEPKRKARDMQNFNREYYKWFSPSLQRDMELLVFGHEGNPVLFFPTRTARFYDYENWGVIEAIKDKISAGNVQLYCVDSADRESFYNKSISPAERIRNHSLFENYILNEVIPLIKQKNKNRNLVSAGCSLGAFHAVNIAFRYPKCFRKVIGMSGRYDLTLQLEYFDDLFEGYRDEHIYFNTPVEYVKDFKNRQTLKLLQKLEIIFAIGVEDAFLDNNERMSKALLEKNIPNTLIYLEGEAHKARYWGELLKRLF